MTASYDGRLVCTKDSMEACCRTMDEWMMTKKVYRSSQGALCLRIDDRKGCPIRCCPFCKAEAEVNVRG